MLQPDGRIKDQIMELKGWWILLFSPHILKIRKCGSKTWRCHSSLCDVNCFPYIWSEMILTICFDLQSDLGRPTIDLAGVYDIGALGYEVSLLDVWRYLHLANINDWIKKSFNRTSCLPIQSLIILVINKSFVVI